MLFRSAIRQARSSLKLGFGVPVRLTLETPASEATWQAIEADVLLGNNVAESDVKCGAAEIRVELEPAGGHA